MPLEQVLSPSVDIIIPLCNERESIQKMTDCLGSLHKRLVSRYKVRYLFVDDGSTDRTGEFLEGAAPRGSHFKILTHPINRGVGAAFRTAFEHVDGDYVCTIDADCSYGPDRLLQMLDALEDGGADVIVASPYHPNGAVQGVQRWRIALSASCSNLYRMLTPLKLYTYTSIFRAYRTKTVKGLAVENDGFVAAVEILLSIDRLGYRIEEMPMTLCRRSTGISKMRVGKTTAAHLKLLKKCLFQPKWGLPHMVLEQKPTSMADATIALITDHERAN